MRPVIRPRPQRRLAHPVGRRAVAASRTSTVARRLDAVQLASLATAPRRPIDDGPYLDYGRFLTPEGGILIVFKDLDLRWRHWVWRVFAWTVASGPEARYILDASPVASRWVNILCWLVVAGLNLFIVWKRIEVYRRIEVRPDCLIIEGKEIFWRERMENGWPELQPVEEEEGVFQLRGVYGTRLVEFFTLRKFDEFDSQPEVFAAHLAQAFEQLWAERTGPRAAASGRSRPGAGLRGAP